MHRDAGGQAVAVEDRKLKLDAVAYHQPYSASRGVNRTTSAINRGKRRLVRKTPAGETVTHDFGHSILRRSIACGIYFTEGALDALDTVQVERDRNREFKRLAGISHVETSGEPSAFGRKARRLQLGFAFAHQL